MAVHRNRPIKRITICPLVADRSFKLARITGISFSGLVEKLLVEELIKAKKRGVEL